MVTTKLDGSSGGSIGDRRGIDSVVSKCWLACVYQKLLVWLRAQAVMDFSLILSAIIAALKFPTELGAFIKLIQATPAEQHASLLVAMQKEADNMKATGRPTWG